MALVGYHWHTIKAISYSRARCTEKGQLRLLTTYYWDWSKPVDRRAIEWLVAMLGKAAAAKGHKGERVTR